MLFEFKIYNKELVKINNQNAINTDRYTKCRFYFQKEIWQDKEIYVTFIDETGYNQIMVLGKWNEVLSCTIPKQFLKGKYFKIFAYTDTLFRTNTIKVNTNLEKCNTCRTHNHNAVKYLTDELKQKIDNIIFEDNQLKCYSNNTLIDTIYIDNVDEAVVQQQIDLHFQNLNPKIDNIIFINNNLICYADNEVVCTIPLSLSDVAWSGDYNDLNNIPETFNPSQHTHQMVDVTDYEDNVSMDLNVLLDFLGDEISKE